MDLLQRYKEDYINNRLTESNEEIDTKIINNLNLKQMLDFLGETQIVTFIRKNMYTHPYLVIHYLLLPELYIPSSLAYDCLIYFSKLKLSSKMINQLSIIIYFYQYYFDEKQLVKLLISICHLKELREKTIFCFRDITNLKAKFILWSLSRNLLVNVIIRFFRDLLDNYYHLNTFEQNYLKKYGIEYILLIHKDYNDDFCKKVCKQFVKVIPEKEEQLKTQILLYKLKGEN